MQEMAHTRQPFQFQPLPDEPDFVVAARDALPQQGRVTTTQIRGGLRGRGRAGSNATERARGRAGSNATERGRGRGRATAPSGDRGRGRGRATAPSGDRGRGKNKTMAVGSTSQPTRERGAGKRKKQGEEGTLYHLLVGDEAADAAARRDRLPDLNAPCPQEEVQITQNAPE
jgi:hypothetical protein